MAAHVIGIALMLLAFGVVIVGGSYVFAMTAEREPHHHSSPR